MTIGELTYLAFTAARSRERDNVYERRWTDLSNAEQRWWNTAGVAAQAGAQEFCRVVAGSCHTCDGATIVEDWTCWRCGEFHAINPGAA